MAEAQSHPDELEILTRAFSGHGVDEKALISILGGASHPDKRRTFRKSNPYFFKEDERVFERWDDHRLEVLQYEFMRIKNAVILCTMHPWERIARLLKEALLKGPNSCNMIIEIACVRRAIGGEKGLPLPLRALNQGGCRISHQRQWTYAAMKGAEGDSLIEDEEVIRRLTTKSKLHLEAVHKHYKEIGGRSLDEDLKYDLRLQETVRCL